jgi:hypothetical protein
VGEENQQKELLKEQRRKEEEERARMNNLGGVDLMRFALPSIRRKEAAENA